MPFQFLPFREGTGGWMLKDTEADGDTHRSSVSPGYSSAPPTCFFFCGNFSSAPYGKNQVQSLKGREGFGYRQARTLN